MVSGGRSTRVALTDVQIGRQIICHENNPRTRATSACAKKMTSTVATAKRGLNAQQLKLWRRMVYAPAVLNVERFCNGKAGGPRVCDPWDPSCAGRRSRAATYQTCVTKVLSGQLQFKDIFGRSFLWSAFLALGRKLITGALKPRLRIFGSDPTRSGNGRVRIW